MKPKVERFPFLRDLAALSLLVAFFTAWYWPGVGEGKVFFDEDVAAQFYTWRASLYALAHGGSWTWWDPMTGLGIPRLGNILVGYLSPVSILFYSIPTSVAYALYPTLALSLLSGFTYALFRSTGIGRLASLFGALSWSSLSAITTHLQHPAYLETILWLPATLFAWQRYLATGAGVWAAASGLGLCFQALGASPQYLFYNLLVMGAWMGFSAWDVRNDTPRMLRTLGVGLGILVIGLGLASWQLLPAIEFSAQSHRELLYDTTRFADHYRAAPPEILLALAAESYAVIEAPPLAHGGGLYRNVPNLSLVTIVFAIVAVAYRPRRLREWAVAGFFLLGMLGSAGGVTSLLESIFPIAERLRAPNRMIVPAAFWIAWLAAKGMNDWARSSAAGPRQAVCVLAILWLMGLGWTLRRPADRYVDPAFFDIPSAIANAEGRVALDIVGSERPPLFAVNAGIAAGTPTFMTREALWPRNLWEAVYASQFGGLQDSAAVDRALTTAVLPLRKPALPLLRAYGLRTLVRHYAGGEYEAGTLPDVLDDFYWVPYGEVATTPPARWRLAASNAWDPRQQAILSAPIENLPAPPQSNAATPVPGSQIRILHESPDYEQVSITSEGGLLVRSGLFFPGWTVSVDGNAAEAHEVNLALRGVMVPPGTHEVEWRYTPTWLYMAAAASGLGLLTLFGFAVGIRAHPEEQTRRARPPGAKL